MFRLCGLRFALCPRGFSRFAASDLRTVPSSAARCFASADFASLCVLEASAASRPPIFAPCRLRRPGVSPLRTSLRSVSSRLQPLRGLRSSHRAVFGGPVFRLCGLRFALCPRGFSRFAASDLRTVPSSAARCFASADFASLCVLEASAASRPPMRAVLPHWAYFALLRPQGARFVRPLATATSSIRNGRSASSHRAAFSGPVFRGCALRFAPCARHFSPSGLRTLASSLAALPPCAHNSQ